MITKKATAKKDQIRVTFELPAEAAEEQAAVVGTFNDWDADADPMTFVKSRKVWKREVKLDPGQRIEFRYYLDGDKWLNEEAADGQVRNQFGTENSVLVV